MEKSLPLKILIADDDSDDLYFWKLIFTKNKNFQIVDCFTNGFDVLNTITNTLSPPDILLIDMYMPILTGTDVLKKLADLNLAQNMITFIISTSTEFGETKNFKHNPNVRFLQKPASLPQINDMPDIILKYFQDFNSYRHNCSNNITVEQINLLPEIDLGLKKIKNI